MIVRWDALWLCVHQVSCLTRRSRPCSNAEASSLLLGLPWAFEANGNDSISHLRRFDAKGRWLAVTQVLQPLYGCDCYAYGLLASGYCDVVVEADMKAYDYMAHVPIVEGAGGVITDWQVGLL